jgi:predicted lipoprotein with Yx(FWY)xxD motif
MDTIARQAEYDADVEAIKAALEHCSKEELLHIAATQIVNGKYAESARRAEREQWARKTVKTLVELVPEMGRKVRK